LLRLLVEAGVRFVVIGGVAAIAHGASTFTRDLDVLISFDAETLSRLRGALQPLDQKGLGRGLLRPTRRELHAAPCRETVHERRRDCR
jgi:hypothetical protein